MPHDLTDQIADVAAAMGFTRYCGTCHHYFNHEEEAAHRPCRDELRGLETLALSLRLQADDLTERLHQIANRLDATCERLRDLIQEKT